MHHFRSDSFTLTTIQQLLQEAKRTLALMTDQPALEAELLLAEILKTSRLFLHTWPEKEVSEEEVRRFDNYIKRRCQKEPIAYIIGKREFWSLEFLVSPATLIPRPETELLVETVLTLCEETPAVRKIADLGTGCGAIALSLAHERPAWQVHAVDISEAALQIARKNAQQLAINHVSFHQGNWCTGLSDSDFDVIVSNPPYLSEAEWPSYVDGLQFEPKSALVSGQDGLDAIRAISQSAKYFLKSNGYIVIEHGFLQGQAVRELFVSDGYSQVHSIRDLASHERVTVGQYHR